MNVPPPLVIFLAVLLSFVSASTLVFLNKDELFKKKPEIKAEFTSVEFDAEDTSYSPQETHAMNQLHKELKTFEESLKSQEEDLDARESALSLEFKELDKQKSELRRLAQAAEDKIKAYAEMEGKALSEEQLKRFKDDAKRWVEMGPEVASKEILQWTKHDQFEPALTTFEQLKAEEKAAIINFMRLSDEDELIDLADALSLRDRTLAPIRSSGIGAGVPLGGPPVPLGGGLPGLPPAN